jgi:hypothetical protein
MKIVIIQCIGIILALVLYFVSILVLSNRITNLNLGNYIAILLSLSVYIIYQAYFGFKKIENYKRASTISTLFLITAYALLFYILGFSL